MTGFGSPPECATSFTATATDSNALKTNVKATDIPDLMS